MVLFLLLMSLLLFWIGRASFRQRRHVLRASTASTASTRTGPIVLRGLARGDPPEPSPVTGLLCAYWEAELHDHRQWRKDFRAQWAIAAKETANTGLIWLEDLDGRMPVLLHGAEWVFGAEDEFAGASRLPPAGTAFVERYGLQATVDEIKVRERRVEEGGPLYVLGTLTKVSDALRLLEQSRRSEIGGALARLNAAARRLVLRQPIRQAVKVHRTEPAGQRLPRDRAAGIDDAHRLVGDVFDPAALLRRRLRPDELVVWCARSGLFIGNCDQSRLARRLERVALICMGAAAAVFLMALALFLLGAAI
jgi:hypothetical protein